MGAPITMDQVKALAKAWYLALDQHDIGVGETALESVLGYPATARRR